MQVPWKEVKPLFVLAFMLSGSESLNGPGGTLLVSGGPNLGLDSYFVGEAVRVLRR